MEIGKLEGYTVISFEGKDIPLKFSSWAIREILNAFGIKLGEIQTLFDYIEVEREVVEGDEVKKITESLPVAKDPHRFAAVLLMSAISYVDKFNGGKGITEFQAYEILDQIGGFNGAGMQPVYGAFFRSIMNGGTPPPPPTIPGMAEEEKKSAIPES